MVRPRRQKKIHQPREDLFLSQSLSHFRSHEVGKELLFDLSGVGFIYERWPAMCSSLPDLTQSAGRSCADLVPVRNGASRSCKPQLFQGEKLMGLQSMAISCGQCPDITAELGRVTYISTIRKSLVFSKPTSGSLAVDIFYQEWYQLSLRLTGTENGTCPFSLGNSLPCWITGCLKKVLGHLHPNHMVKLNRCWWYPNLHKDL
jgi:hypothetical protein